MKAVIFDMDGLLLDTETVAVSIFVDSCREVGFDPDLRIYYKCIGTTSAKTKQILIEGYGKDFPYDDVAKSFRDKFQARADDMTFPIKTGSLELLQYLEQKRIRRAVVTSTRHDLAQTWLNKAAILEYFALVLGGDEVSIGKPNPDIYIEACRRLKEEPIDCLALEDSDNGVLSATQAGLTVIQIPDIVQPSEQIKGLGHRIVGTLLDVQRILQDLDRQS